MKTGHQRTPSRIKPLPVTSVRVPILSNSPWSPPLVQPAVLSQPNNPAISQQVDQPIDQPETSGWKNTLLTGLESQTTKAAVAAQMLSTQSSVEKEESQSQKEESVSSKAQSSAEKEESQSQKEESVSSKASAAADDDADEQAYDETDDSPEQDHDEVNDASNQQSGENRNESGLDSKVPADKLMMKSMFHKVSLNQIKELNTVSPFEQPDCCINIDQEIVTTPLFVQRHVPMEEVTLDTYAANSLPRLDLLPVLAQHLVADQKLDRKIQQKLKSWLGQIYSVVNRVFKRNVVHAIEPLQSPSQHTLKMQSSKNIKNPCLRLLNNMDLVKIDMGNKTDNKTVEKLVPSWWTMFLDMSMDVLPSLGAVWTIYFITLRNLARVDIEKVSPWASAVIRYSTLYPAAISVILYPWVLFLRQILYFYYRMMRHGHFLVFKQRTVKSFYSSSFFVLFTLLSVLEVVATLTIVHQSCEASVWVWTPTAFVLLLQSAHLVRFYHSIYMIHQLTLSFGEYVHDNPSDRKQVLHDGVYVQEDTLKSDCLAVDWLYRQMESATQKISLNVNDQGETLKAFYRYLNFEINFRHIGCYNLPRPFRNDFRLPNKASTVDVHFSDATKAKPLSQWNDKDWKPLIDVVNERLNNFEYVCFLTTSRANVPDDYGVLTHLFDFLMWSQRVRVWTWAKNIKQESRSTQESQENPRKTRCCYLPVPDIVMTLWRKVDSYINKPEHLSLPYASHRFVSCLVLVVCCVQIAGVYKVWQDDSSDVCQAAQQVNG